MHKFILKRVLMLIPVLLGVTLLVYFILSLTPGDPARMILGEGATQQAVDELREEMGLNDPVIVQYARYLGGLVRFDFGVSWKTGLSVSQQILEKFPNTMLLSLASILFALIIGIPVGILSARKQYSIADNVSMLACLVGISMPSFWLGLLLVILFSLQLDWLPSSGMGYGASVAVSLILPAITLGAASAAMIARMTRSSMLEVIRQDYVYTARAKGMNERVVTFRHMLRNALIPIVTVVGLQFGTMLGGAVLVETVFSWPGIGRYMIDAIKMRDTPAILGSVIFLAIIFTLVNLLIDILYAFIDPRIKAQYKNAKSIRRRSHG